MSSHARIIPSQCSALSRSLVGKCPRISQNRACSRRPPPLRRRLFAGTGSVSDDPTPEIPIDDGEGLTPEEDFVVSGGSNDSLSSNTDLGKAVRAACDELDHLGGLEAELMEEAFDILKGAGITLQKPSDVKKGLEEKKGENSS
ncbi:hypothetical protein BSKO_01139 [Bryopsis sp. KO-2023]|nr:hypothetical protein BSKO_01139 [Bryopsis sp. KO-2023]